MKYPNETVDTFVSRCVDFFETLNKSGHEKIMIVSHGTVCVALAQLAIGKEPEDILSVCEETQECVNKYSGQVPESVAEQLVYLTGMKPCGITLIKDQDPVWFSRIVYE